MIDTADKKSLNSLKKKMLPFARAILGLFVLLCLWFALRYVWGVIQSTSIREITAAVRSISAVRIFGAILLVGIAYFVMTGYDTFALRMAGSRLPYRKIAFVSFVGDTINANMALSALVGSAVKLRLYMGYGEAAAKVIGAIASYTAAYWAGFSLLFSISGILSFFISSSEAFLPDSPAYKALAVVASAVTLLYLVACFGNRILKKVPSFIPHGIMGLKLLAVGFLDWTFTSLIFLVLTPAIDLSQFPAFINLYLFSFAIGLISQTPGGLGVFESVCLLLGKDISTNAMLGTLLTFRLLFFVLPLCTSLTLFGLSKLLKLLLRPNNRRIFKKEKTDGIILTDKDTLPFVSVVIPAYNEEKYLPACLSALKSQDYKGRTEIIVVDNASTDNTAEIAASYGCRVIYEPTKGYNRAITTGFNAAHGDIIACTDADTIVGKQWISKLVLNLSRKNVVACGGLFTFHDGPFLLRILAFLFGKLNYHIAGANMAMWKHAYVRCGGFSSDINLGADVDIDKRLRKLGKVIIDRSLTVATSSRRFANAFWRTVVMYYLNDFCLLFLNRAFFYSFKDYRTFKPAEQAYRGRELIAAMTFFIILFAGHFGESPFYQITGTANGTGIKAVALTFDDGPGVSTQEILDILKSSGVKATFFVIGKNALNNQQILKRISEDGHEIGNHSYNHSLHFSIESPKSLEKELDSTSAIIKSVTGSAPTLFRPPRGWRNPWMADKCASKGYKVVLWNVDSFDWLNTSTDRIVENVLRKTKSGSIILLHDRLNTGKDKRRAHTINALPRIIKALSAEGFIFVTISELYEMKMIEEFRSTSISNLY